MHFRSAKIIKELLTVCKESAIVAFILGSKYILQPVNNTFKKGGDTESAMIVKIHKDAENDDSKYDEPFKHISQ